jgi:hypothetical protein
MSSAVRPLQRALLLAALATLPLSGCITAPDEFRILQFAGEWCSVRSLGANGLPAPGVPYIGMVLFEENRQILGSGSRSRPGDDVIWTTRYIGDVTGSQAVIQVQDLNPNLPAPGPTFVMTLEAQERGTLVGTIVGDADFAGPVTFAALGPRCFVN